MATGTTTIAAYAQNNQPAYGIIYSALSGNGRYVAFNVFDVTLAVNGAQQVYVRDLVTGQTVLASVNAQGVAANGSSDRLDSPRGLALSDTGRYVAFQSQATNLVPGDTNNSFDIFVRDLTAGTINRVSLTSAGTQSAGGIRGATDPDISNDGRYIAFESDAGDLVRGDSNFSEDIFVRDTVAGTTVIASISSTGVQGSFDSQNPSLSGNGRFVAFDSITNELVPGDTNGASDIFVRDLVANTTTRVSVASGGIEGTGQGIERFPGSFNPSISADGRFVAFESRFTNLVPNDTNGVSDIFVYDQLTGTTSRVSVGTGGVQANGGSVNPYISADGRFVAFQSAATNLSSGDTNGSTDVFLHDRLTGTTSIVSVNNQSQQIQSSSFTDGISDDGRFVLFSSNNLTNVPVDQSAAIAIAVSGFPLFSFIRDTQPSSPLPTGASQFSANSPGFSSPGFGTPAPAPTGVNVIKGNNRNNRLRGTAGPDLINGEAGNDTLLGLGGNDSLVGGRGRDRLSGGKGNDQFVYLALGDRGDQITDFTPKRDKIVLTSLLDRFGYNGQNALADRLIRLVRRGSDIEIQVDRNGRRPGGFVSLVTVEDVSIAQLRNVNNFLF